MNKEEFKSWSDRTKLSERGWQSDDIHNGQKGRDLLLYKGGSSGTYIRVTQDGTAEVGEYSDAVPHIGEAMFLKKHSNKLSSNLDDAFGRLCERLGIGFLLELTQGKAVYGGAK
jgi:hypothetical protein